MFFYELCRLGRIVVLSLAFVCGVDCLCLADELVLINGDVLHGRVVSIEEQTCVFESDVLGEMRIAMENLQTFSTDANTPILLQGRDEPVDGCVRGAENGVFVYDGEDEYLLALDSVLALGDYTTEALEEADVDAWVWSGSGEVGYRSRSGNSERATLHSRGEVALANSLWTLSGHIRSYYSEQEVDGRDKITDDEIQGGIRIARNLTERLSAYIALDLERDKVENLRLRRTFDGGFCWRLFNDDRFNWLICGGIGQENEEFYNGREEQFCIARISSDAAWKVFDRFKLTQQTEWLPSFESMDAYRIVAETAGVVYLDNDEHFFWKMGLRHEYDNQPDGDDIERLDSYFFSSIGFSF